jgi:MFS family permease
MQDNAAVSTFAVLFGLGWLLQYNYYTTIYPALQDVVEPRLRATAMAVYFAGQYILGGAIGTLAVGWLSDRFSQSAMNAAGTTVMTEQFKAIGLHDALYLVPVTLLLAGFFVFLASRTYHNDHLNMIEQTKAK